MGLFRDTTGGGSKTAEARGKATKISDQTILTKELPRYSDDKSVTIVRLCDLLLLQSPASSFLVVAGQHRLLCLVDLRCGCFATSPFQRCQYANRIRLAVVWIAPRSLQLNSCKRGRLGLRRIEVCATEIGLGAVSLHAFGGAVVTISGSHAQGFDSRPGNPCVSCCGQDRLALVYFASHADEASTCMRYPDYPALAYQTRPRLSSVTAAPRLP